MQVYSGQGRHSMAAAIYERYRHALEEFGLPPSSTLRQALTAALPSHDRIAGPRPQQPRLPRTGAKSGAS